MSQNVSQQGVGLTIHHGFPAVVMVAVKKCGYEVLVHWPFMVVLSLFSFSLWKASAKL